jgi:hypothetical protein
MTSARRKGYKERITSAVCAKDLYGKLDQMLFKVKEDSACCLLKVKSAGGPFS